MPRSENPFDHVFYSSACRDERSTCGFTCSHGGMLLFMLFFIYSPYEVHVNTFIGSINNCAVVHSDYSISPT